MAEQEKKDRPSLEELAKTDNPNVKRVLKTKKETEVAKFGSAI